VKPYHFALLDQSRNVSGADLYALKFAMEACAADITEAWKRYSVPAAFCELFDVEDKVPHDWHLIRFISDSKEDPGALAVHYYDARRAGPIMDIYTDRAGGFNVGANSICEAACHELEAMINPAVGLWDPHPVADRAADGVQVAREIADPVQDTYDERIGGTVWRVANFVTPAWFGLEAGTRYDHAGRLSSPGEIGPEGYTVCRRRDPQTRRWEYWYEDRTGDRFASAPKNGARRGHGRSRVTMLREASEAQDATERAERATEPDRQS